MDDAQQRALATRTRIPAQPWSQSVTLTMHSNEQLPIAAQRLDLPPPHARKWSTSLRSMPVDGVDVWSIEEFLPYVEA